MPNQYETLYRGITAFTNEQGILAVKLHYSADLAKNSAWVAEHKPKAVSEEWWNQEQEIDFGARQGSLIYQLKDEATLCKSFAIPDDWTRFFVLDTHPRKPHAFLWGAMSPHNVCYIYRELWPSKAYGKPAMNVPEDDNLWSFRQYVGTVKWLESKENDLKCADGKTENALIKGEAENIYERIIDYAARAFGKDAMDPGKLDYQRQYEETSTELKYPFYFVDCTKDNEAAYAEVNEWLRPYKTLEPGSDEPVSRSKLQIFSDKCPELVYQLKTNRMRQMQPHQVDVQDPQLRPVDKRNDLTDDLKYLCMRQPEYVKKVKRSSVWAPAHEGIAW